jgi:two-component system phosphate regulon sensor histidine kinase PhoR
VDGWLVAIVALLIGGAAAVLGISSRRTLSTIATLAPDPPDDPVAAVRSLSERADRLDADSTRRERDREAFVDSLTQGILEVDGGLRIVAANRAAGTLLGRDPRTLVGRTVIEVFLDTQVEATAIAGLGSGSATGEFGPAGADGPRLVVRARRAPSGSLWLVLEDVSELRRLQQIRTEFIDNLSHELRTPLTTVSLLAETLTREAEAAGDAVPPRMRDRIDKIEVETGHLVQMVNELLDLSRIESGGALGALEILDLGQIATDSAERLRLFADRQGVALRVDVGASLPPVRGDAARLGQVIVNLLHNAVKFSPDGGDVVVAVRGSASEAEVSIADHGVGIPATAQPRIFERFYKVDRARVRGEAGGTGLGLAIARHIVEQHGGRIWVDSVEGSGSTFSFALPSALDRSRPEVG